VGPNLPDEASPGESPIADAGLTRRELDVLPLLTLGRSNREISRQLFLSEGTVKAHLAAVFRKLGVSNRTQAALAAVAMGIGTPPRLHGSDRPRPPPTGMYAQGSWSAAREV
jgi:DNA-binding NarL/FixJ family response regulator